MVWRFGGGGWQRRRTRAGQQRADSCRGEGEREVGKGGVNGEQMKGARVAGALGRCFGNWNGNGLVRVVLKRAAS